MDIRVCDSVRIGQLPSRIRFNQLDESIWERTSSHHCEELAQALVEIVRLSLPDLLECRTEQTLPPLPHGVELDDLSLSVRTYNCLNNSYEGDLRVLRKAIFENVLSLPGFGARSLVDLLVAIETCVATAAPEAAPFAGDERQAARLYVAQLIHRHPTLRRKLQSSLDYQLSQYNGFIHKGIWASQARAAFDAKVSYGLEVSATLPLWPSSQIALDFEATAEEEPKSQTTQQEPLANETQTKNLIVSGDNRVLDHVAQVADLLNAVDEQSDVFRASSHRLAALMHSGFEPNVANEELKQMRSSIQSLTEIVATWEKFASSLQDGQHLSHQPDEEVRAATKRIADISGATSIRCDDPRFGDYVNRLDSQSQTLEEAFARAINQSCQPHLRIQLQECLRALEVYLKVCSAMTVEEELHSLVKSALELSSTRLNTQRQEEMCARRYGWDGQGGATLQEMALDVGVNRERIRQICKPVEQAIGVLAPLEPCVPSLKRALQFAAERAPVSLQEIEDELHDAQITKGRLRVRQLLRIAGWLGCPSPIAISQIGGQADGQPMVVLVDDDNGVPEQRKVNNVLQKARKAVSRWGTAHIEEIAANVIEDFGGENSESDIRRIIHVLESQPDFAWLDEENGWFWFSSTPRNGLVTQINKALAVASRLRVADLRAAVSRHHRRQGFAPPQRVLLELCRQCGFSVHEGIIDAKSSSDSSDALSETEWYMVQVLNEHGPFNEPRRFRATLSRFGYSTRNLLHIPEPFSSSTQVCAQRLRLTRC